MKNNRLKVQKILRSVLLDAFRDLSFANWDVMEFGSADFTNSDKVVLTNLVRSQRLGWQHDNIINATSSVKRKDEWIDLEHWQLHVIAKRPKNATDETIVTEDIAESLIAWLNGPGMLKFRSNGIAPERIDGKTIFVYNDDNEIYQKRAVFTVKIEVPKELTTDAIEADAVKPKVMPV